ncbi:hypothetical protein [Thiorhodococcus fuscus]|uniref:Uncharacterized protein n=1 Tax=Thiorhodococcus fuscus TaxID=527200 RepID=A0ABW4Y8U8_9GAMM
MKQSIAPNAVIPATGTGATNRLHRTARRGRSADMATARYAFNT